MDDKKIIILPEATARAIVRKSISRVGGAAIKFDSGVTLRELGLKSKTDLIEVREAIAVEIAKVTQKQIDPKRFAPHLKIRPTQTAAQLLRGVQKAYTLGLSGDVIPPDYDKLV